MENMPLKSLKKFQWGDILVCMFLLAGAAFSIPVMINSEPQTVRVFRDNEILATYPLYQDKELTFAGFGSGKKPLCITIKNNSVAITESDCPHHLCVKSGPISHPGQQIVCAPNHILITISSNSTQKEIPDGIAR